MFIISPICIFDILILQFSPKSIGKIPPNAKEFVLILPILKFSIFISKFLPTVLLNTPLHSFKSLIFISFILQLIIFKLLFSLKLVPTIPPKFTILSEHRGENLTAKDIYK